MKKVLIVNPHYYPGYKSGGPQQTVCNICDAYSEKADIYLVTKNCDFGENEPYPNIETNKWYSSRGISVMYVEPKEYGIPLFKRLYKEFDHILCCGLFATSTVKFLAVHRFMRRKKELFVAPMGVFNRNAFGSKKTKKATFIKAGIVSGLFKDIIWSFTSETEKTDAEAILGKKGIKRSIIAEDIPKRPEASITGSLKKIKKAGHLDVIFLSRICPQKNLMQVLEIIDAEYDGTITLDIYGTTEDKPYWNECKKKMKTLPNNIKAEYKGALRPDETVEVFSNHDVFLFPTKGENFGHVIYESLLGGCLPIISDETPWKDLDDNDCGKVIPLDDTKQYKIAVADYLKIGEAFESLRMNAVNYANNKYAEATLNSGYDKVFL